MDAMQIYRKLSRPPETALRQIQAGNLKGKTDINPQWRYEAMTETFGLVGIGWKYEVKKLWTEPGANGETLAFAEVAVYIRDPETKEWSEGIVGIGGSKLINRFSKGPESNDEGFKMAVTDAFSTSLKMIGVAADIYAGRWDGSKYKEQQVTNANQRPQQKGPAGGPDTPEELNEINRILALTDTAGNPLFSPVDFSKIVPMRNEKTAAQVIEWLKQEAEERKAKSSQLFEEDIPF